MALFVSEWGTVKVGGSGDPNLAETSLWLEFLDANSISYCTCALSFISCV